MLLTLHSLCLKLPHPLVPLPPPDVLYGGLPTLTSTTWMDGRKDGWMDGLMDGWVDGWTDGRTDGRTDGWISNRHKKLSLVF